MSRTLLAKRLGEREAEGLIERRRTFGEHPEYRLTDSGESLRPIVVELGNLGKRWVGQDVSGRDLDAGLLLWDMQRRINREQLPDRRVVVCFRFPYAPEKHRDFWLVLERDQVDLCLKDPGYEEDLYVTADVESMTRIWLGDTRFDPALRDGAISLGGPGRLREQFPGWLGLSLFAGVRRAHGASTAS